MSEPNVKKSNLKDRDRYSTRSLESRQGISIIGSDGSGLVVDDDADTKSLHPEALPARDVTITNAYNIGPAFGCKFPVPHIRYMIDRVLYDKLRGKTYTAADAVKWVREVADDVNLKMKGYCVQPRYKHVVNVIIYQQNGAGCFYGARAIWDLLTDDYAMTTFNGNTFMCIVTVFGVYQY